MSAGRPDRSLGALVFVVAAGHLSLFPKVADLDGFYHIGHTAAYLEGSFSDTSLPWATQSIIRDRAADLWWGFHVLLAPFALFDDPAMGIRLAALALTTVIGLTVLWILRRHGVAHAGWWAAGFLVAVPNVFFRFLMLRPHVVSLAASLAIISVLVRGRWWQVLLLSALVSWVHLSLFWIAPGLVAAYALTRIPLTVAGGVDPEDRGVPIGAALAAVAVGTAAGWLVRPAPLATGALLNVQLVRLFAQKATEEPMLFSAELMPIGIGELLRTGWLYSGLWALALLATCAAVARGTLDRIGRERATLLIVATLVSIAFLGLALVSARRAMVQWVAFGFLTLPLVWTLVGGERGDAMATQAAGRTVLPTGGARSDTGAGTRTDALSDPDATLRPGAPVDPRRIARALLVVMVAADLAWGAWRHQLNVDLVAFDGRSLADAATYLEANSDPGDVVFHARWDNFGPLLAHDRINRYLGGMDPIFQFAHDPHSYWEFFYLSADVSVEWTCDAFPCAAGVATDTYAVIRDHFGARWVLVEPRRNPRFSLYLLNDPRFRLALETQREAVFEVLPEPPVGPEGH